MTAIYGYPCHFVKFEERDKKCREKKEQEPKEVKQVMTDVTKEKIEKLN